MATEETGKYGGWKKWGLVGVGAVLGVLVSLNFQAIAQRADAVLLAEWVPQADVVLDCSDNFRTRQAVNAACVAHGIGAIRARDMPSQSRGASIPRVRASSSAVSTRSDPSRWR